ncbi:MAG: sarcosine oxidase subunit beta [Planctomycetota bacterium]
MKAKVLIIGGGVMGTSIAMHLADRMDPFGDPLVLLERAPALAAGSSGRSGAILRTQYADLNVARMAQTSLRDYSTFMTRTGRDIGFHKAGALTLAGPLAPEWIERTRDCVEMLQAGGLKTELVDAARMRALIPGIVVADDAIGAWEPDSGFVDPVATVEAFAAIARTRGAVTRLGVEVTSLLLAGDRITGVETSEGRYEAEQVILVAGPWSHALLAQAGLNYPLRAVRPEQHFLAMPHERRNPSQANDFDDFEGGSDLDALARLEQAAAEKAETQGVAHPVVIDLELGFYSRCVPDRKSTRVGKIEYESDAVVADPDSLDEQVSDEMKTWARQALSQRMPVYAELPDTASEAALYTLTPDAQALIGEVAGARGLIVATGFSGHGFKLAPTIGEGVCQMVMGDPVTALDPDFFNPQRFEGRAVHWGGKFGL